MICWARVVCCIPEKTSKAIELNVKKTDETIDVAFKNEYFTKSVQDE